MTIDTTRLRALAADKPAEDTRYWYWRASDGETRPEGPYATREAALADVPGYYAVGEMPERVLVGRCTDPLSLTWRKWSKVQASCAYSPCRPSASVTLVWEWVTDPDEEWVDVAEPQEGGER